MPDEVSQEDAAQPLRTLADKVSWLIDRAHPVGSKALSNSDVSFMIHKATGQQVSDTTIWKLRNGQNTNPQMRLIDALARTFGVPAAFFFDDYADEELGLLQEQVELLALIRDADITAVELRAILGLDREGRQVITKLIERTARGEGRDAGEDPRASPGAL